MKTLKFELTVQEASNLASLLEQAEANLYRELTVTTTDKKQRKYLKDWERRKRIQSYICSYYIRYLKNEIQKIDKGGEQ